MIKSVTVINNVNEQLKLSLSEPWDTGLIIESITGIGPGKANLNNIEMASSDGAIFTSGRVATRNIVLQLRFLEKPDIETTRHLTYQFFPLKKDITLIFETDHREIAIAGHVEGNDPDIFSNEERTQISILCEDPYFYADTENYVLNGVQSMFTFPFSNNSLTEDLINFGEIIYSTGIMLNYLGDIESGVIIHIHAIGAISGFSIKNLVTQVEMTLDTSKIKAIVGGNDDDIIASDDIYISTMPTDKYCRLLRDGVWYNILPCLPKLTDWITIQKGENMFRYDATSGATNALIDIKSYVIYAGV